MAGEQRPARTAKGGAGNHSGQQHGRRKSSRRRAIAWVAGVAGAGVTAFVVAYFTTLGNHVAGLSTAPGRPAQPGGQPVKIDYVAVQQGPDQSAVAPGPLTLTAAQLSSLNSLNQTTPAVHQWFAAHDAVTADNLFVELIVAGNRDSAVRIVSMQPVVSCHPPLAGTLFYSPAAGADSNTQLMVNLDHPLGPPGYIANVNGQISHGANFFQHFTVSLKRGEQYTFLVNAHTTKQYCQFTLDLTVLEGSRTVTESVSDNGKPFAVTAVYNEDDLNPGAFSRYQDVYVGGVAASGLPGSGTNSFGDPLWLEVNPATYRQ